MRLQLSDANASAVINGNRARFLRALPGASLEYRADSTEVKEIISLASRHAQRRFRYLVHLSPGIVARPVRTGAIRFMLHGKAVFTLQPPVMWDHSQASRPAAHGARMAIHRHGQAYELIVAPSPSWLADPRRRYPVVIDPTVTTSAVTNDCYIANQSAADQTFCEQDPLNLKVGSDGTQTYRSLINFQGSGVLPPQIDVLDAEVNLYLAGQTTGASSPVNVHEITHYWTAGSTGATWNRYDSFYSSTLWSQPGGDYQASAAATTTIAGGPGWYHWYPSNQLLQDWVDGIRPEYGLLLKQSDETINNVLTFWSSRDPANGYTQTPYMAIYYEQRLGQLPRYTYGGETPPEPVLVDDNVAADPALRFDINVATGNLLLREQDFLHDATGLDVDITRYWNAFHDEPIPQDDRTSPLGAGWFLGTGSGIELRPMRDGSWVYYGPSGYAKLFQKKPNGTFTPPLGFPATLVRNPGTGNYRLTLLDEDVTLVFSSVGRLLLESGTEGGSLSFSYDGAGKLAAITDGDGGQTVFSYDPVSGLLADITDPTGADYHYDHDPAGNLTRLTDPSGKHTDMQYNVFGDLVQVTDRLGREYKFGYGPTSLFSDHRVRTVTHVTDPVAGTGPTTTYSYGSHSTIVTDPDGTTHAYAYDRGSIVRTETAGASPPSIFVTSGALPGQDGTVLSLSQTYNLRVDAYDSSGMRSIEVVVDGASDDDTALNPCPQTSPPTSCGFNWTFDTETYAGGEYLVTAIATANNGSRVSRSFLVFVPPNPASTDGISDHVVSDSEEMTRARSLRTQLGFRADDAYITQLETDPAAQAARTEYGIPMTSGEMSDVQVREDAQGALSSVEDYIAASPAASSTFAGLYIDQPSGGTVNVGFTQNASTRLAEIAQIYPYPDRLRAFTATRTQASLQTLSDQILADVPTLESQGVVPVEISVDTAANTVDVGVEAPTAAQAQTIQARYGDAARLIQVTQPSLLAGLGRGAYHRHLLAGLRIVTGASNTCPPFECCTSGFSAFRSVSGHRRYFMTTAGHCPNGRWYQGGKAVGSSKENYFGNGSTVDAQLVNMTRRRRSMRIFGTPTFSRVITRVESIARDEHNGELVCKSGPMDGITNPQTGASAGVSCGTLLQRDAKIRPQGTNTWLIAQRKANVFAIPGDSGAPVFRRVRGAKALASGLVSAATGSVIMYYSSASRLQTSMHIFICTRVLC
jgi:YD repeat-containing protein